MKSTKIKVIELTHDEMLNHKEKAYNQSIWTEKVNRMVALGARFYEAKPDAVYSYSRFFTEYRIKNEGLYFLNQFGYSSSITSNGFTKAFIIDGEIFTMGFGIDRDSTVINTFEGRKWLVKNVCDNGIMVSNCL